MYVEVGEFADAATLCDVANAFEYYWAPQGYWGVDGRFSALESTFRSLVPGQWVFSMLTQLREGNSIPPHADKPLSPWVTRYHYVLGSNDYSWCMHDGVWQQLLPGHIYTMEPQYVHAAINWGATPRTHLVVDIGDPQ